MGRWSWRDSEEAMPRLLASCVALLMVFGQTPMIRADQAAQALNLIVGKGQVMDFTTNVARASITDPKVASVVIISPKELLINGKAAGVTNLLVWDEQDKSQVYDVEVQANTSQLADMLQQIAPNDNISVHAAKDSVVITGEVMRPTTLTEVDKIATAFAGKGEKVVNLLRVTEPAQVMLKVRVIEVDRTALQGLGMDFFLHNPHFVLASQAAKTGMAFLGDQPVGNTQRPYPTLYPDNILFPENTDLFSLMKMGKHNGLTYLQPNIQLQEGRNLVRVLAEPNLIAKSGEEATFLAGGEIPIPVVTANAVQITYKEFGVKLKFKPIVTETGLIRLAVEPEVSSIDPSNSVTVGGISVPGFRTRKTQTTVELQDNQTLIIGGLLSQETTKAASKIPMVSDLPVIGDLFKSEKFNKGETELLILVSPSLVRPNNFLPIKPLTPDRDLAPFVTQAGRAPLADPQGDKFRSTYGHKRDAVWEPEREADPFLRRMDETGEFNSSQGAFYPPGAGPSTVQPGSVGGFPISEEGQSNEYDPEYHATLEKYQLISEDPQYSQIPGMLRQRLWGRTGVADESSEPSFGSLWEQLGYRAPSW